ncbi:MAG: hypothetical protein ABIN61_01735 [candidate division WOR-3 bacterium]
MAFNAFEQVEYQYSGRCVSSGFTAYYENISVAHSCIFARLSCEFLKGNGSI